MKTTNKTVAPVRGSSFNELIFENRNHAYGAYELRKKYEKRLLIGFLFAFFIFSSAISVQVIENYFNKTAFIFVPPTTTKIELSDLDIEKPVPPPPPEPEVPENLKKQAVFVPEIVDTTTSDILLPTTEDFIESTENNTPPVLAVVPENRKPNDGIDVPDKEYWAVEESAMFNGGDINKFREWLVNNLTYPQDAIETEINGKVHIVFGVNPKGEVCNVTIRRGVHPSLDEAVTRTILNSPVWQPAKQNGTPVKQMFSLVVYFRQ